MREIKFRGQGVYDGDWHYGFYREFTMPSCWKHEAYKDGVNYYIDEKGSNESYLVIPSTIGQYTGLKDKNGKEIYEGDIVTVFDAGEVFTGIVAYDLEECDFKATNGEEDYGNNFSYIGSVIEEIEVIGNIYENPELLKEGE